MDVCIIVGDTSNHINKLIESLHKGDENFVLQDEGLIDKYLGVGVVQAWVGHKVTFLTPP